jgi:hypothetical protein
VIQRSKRRLYDNPLLHIQIVRLLLRLLISPQQTSLNKLYCDRMPIGDQGIDPSAGMFFLNLSSSPHFFDALTSYAIY